MGSIVAELAEKLSASSTGTTQTGALTVGVDDTGHDVKFFGATAGAFFEWDESADELEIRGPVATPGKLLLSTAEATVVDGNKLGQINFQAPVHDGTGDALLVGASIYAEADATFSTTVNSTDLVFATGDSAAATEKLRIDSTGQVTFADGAIDVNIASHDTSNGLKLGGTLVSATAAELNYLDITTLGTSQASKAVTVDASGDLLIPDSDKFKFGAGSDMQLYHDGTNSYITNAVGALKIATETSGIAVSIGHTTSETTVNDNLTVTGTLTVAGHLIQTVYATSETVQASSSAAWMTAVSASITLSDSSHKLLAFGTMRGEAQSTGQHSHGGARMGTSSSGTDYWYTPHLEDGTGPYGIVYKGDSAHTARLGYESPMNHLFAPAHAGSVTVSIQGRRYNTSDTFYINAQAQGDSNSDLVLQEYAL